ncbi:MAG: hypothetical protein QXV69_06385 [Sulfolobaceae archaeon]
MKTKLFVYLALILISISSVLFIPTTAQSPNQQLILLPQGSVSISTNSSPYNFPLVIINNSPYPNNGTLVISGATSNSIQVNVQPYSYVKLNVKLNQGVNTITLGKYSLVVNVTVSNYYLTPKFTFNNNDLVIVSSSPSVFQGTLTISRSNNVFGIATSGFSTNIYFSVTGYINYLIFISTNPVSSNTVSVSVDTRNLDLNIPQGLYYLYVSFTYLASYTVNNKTYSLQSFTYGVILFNISKGLNGILSSPSVITSGAYSLYYQKINNNLYVLIKPFSILNNYTIYVNTTAGNIAVNLQNITRTISKQSYFVRYTFYGNDKNYSMAYTNDWAEIVVPISGNLSNIYAIVKTSSGSYTISSTTTTMTTTTTTTTSTSVTTTTTMPPSTTTTTYTTTTTTTTTSISTTTTTTTTSTTSPATTQTSVPATTTTTPAPPPQTTTAGGAFPVLPIVIAVIVIIIVVLIVLLLRRR